MILKTSRLVLRPLVTDDADAMFEAIDDPAVMEFWDWPGAQSIDEARGFVSALCDEAAAGTAIHWAITLGGVVLGSCDLSEIDRHHRRAEVGFMLAQRYWNKGYALEAMQAAIAFGFDALELERLSARTHSGNASSAKLLAKLRFRHEGTLKAFVRRDGARRDCEIYGLMRG